MKYSKLGLLNFEGDVLVAHKRGNVFIIMDQWGQRVAIFLDEGLRDFIEGRITIRDSRNKEWNFINEHENAKPNPKVLEEFLAEPSMIASLQAITKPLLHDLSAEEFITYIARVSNPSNQLNTQTAPKLIKYLIDHKHWSPFEHVSLTFEIKTTRAIAAQILRHRSFTFQEFSQRYASDIDIILPEMRMQADKNRQGSNGDSFFPEGMEAKIKEHLESSKSLYNELIEKNVAKETARFILPLCAETTIYMSGTLRSFIHYIQLRSEPETQKEHREIVLAMIPALEEHFPLLTKILEF